MSTDSILIKHDDIPTNEYNQNREISKMEVKAMNDLKMHVKFQNNACANAGIEHSIQDIVKWHDDRGILEGATAWDQTKKLFEEFIELVSAQMPGASTDDIAEQVYSWTNELEAEGRIKPIDPENAHAAAVDALGDMAVVKVHIMESFGVSYNHCVKSAYDQIKDRKGRLVNGIWTKEEDL